MTAIDGTKCLLLNRDRWSDPESWPEVVGWFDTLEDAKLAGSPADRNGKVWRVSEWTEVESYVLEDESCDFRIYVVRR